MSRTPATDGRQDDADGAPGVRPRASDELAECWYRTLGGAVVVVATTALGLRFQCQGCHEESDWLADQQRANSQANAHASRCHSTPDPNVELSATAAAQVALELRADLQRIEAKAAAGIALSAAVLLGVIAQTPHAQPVFSFGVGAAALLTIAVLGFFTVLLPRKLGGAHSALAEVARSMRRGSIADDHGLGRLHSYRAAVVEELLEQVQAKDRRLALALTAGALAVVLLAAGATIALAFGLR